MRLFENWLPHLAVTLSVLYAIDARRVRVQQVQDDDIQYYDPQEQGQRVVLVSSDDYNGIYGQQASSRSLQQDNYVPSRSQQREPVYKESRTKQAEKAPPVQTIRNYNKVNDDGSFTFGYEAADGSFKEETRGTDCVVRGKYGYVDPDGNKREFTYVSGNPCDPNAKDESEEKPEEEERDGPENIPNYPQRPVLRPRPTIASRPVTVYQNTYDGSHDEVEQPEPEQVLRPTPEPVRHRVLPARPAYIPEQQRQAYIPEPAPVLIQQRPRTYHPVTPATTYREEQKSITVTAKPQPTSLPSRQLPATTYRPQLLQVAVTPRPALLYTTKQIPQTPSRQTTHYPSSTPASVSHSSALDFAAEFQKFQQDNQIHSSTQSPLRTAKPATLHTNVQQGTSNPIYSSELVFDPSSGQYNTAVYQTLPQTEGDFSLNHRIQPYVHQPQPQLVSLRELQQQSPLYRQQYRPSQAAYQQQQAELQFHNSQQLFAQQQKARSQGSHQPQRAQTEPQQFYYIQPSLLNNHGGLATGQIDAFLRGHNIQF